jgi:hypothetical protein
LTTTQGIYLLDKIRSLTTMIITNVARLKEVLDYICTRTT